MIAAITIEQADYRFEIRVQRGFAAKQSNAAPLDAGSHTLGQKSFQLGHRHVDRGRRLRAGAITIVAAQIAAIGDVDFNPPPAANKRAPEEVDQRALAAKSLPEIKQQALEGYIAVNRRSCASPAIPNGSCGHLIDGGH